jgi:hypothetical protein
MLWRHVFCNGGKPVAGVRALVAGDTGIADADLDNGRGEMDIDQPAMVAVRWISTSPPISVWGTL